MATTAELTLFNRYVAPWIKAWRFEVEEMAGRGFHQGLPCVWSEAELRRFLDRFVSEVYSRVLERHPQATHVLDKQPGYSEHVQLIDSFLPDAHFIHLLRDGRDVAVSMVAAGEPMGFGRITVDDAAQLWVRTVRGALAARTLQGRYLEVRYEALCRNPAEVLASVFSFLDLSGMDAARVEAVVAHHDFARLQRERLTGDPRIRAHPLHYRRGIVGGWRDSLDVLDRYAFHGAAWDLLQEMGYETDPEWWSRSATLRAAVPAWSKVTRVAKRLTGVGLRIMSSRGATKSAARTWTSL